MKALSLMRKNKLLLIVALIYIFLLIFMPEKAIASFDNSMYYIKEMLLIMPIILILTAIIEAWVPKEVIVNSLGENSGIKGSVLSFILGSVSAGPIYVAFPISKMLLKKGASIANIVIILSAWAVVKVPMLANEAKFLGIRFMGIRWALTTISIFVMAYLTTIIVKKESLYNEDLGFNPEHNNLEINEQYCMGCGICAYIAPNSFEMDSNKKARFKNTELDEGEIEAAVLAAERCPFKAIYISS